MGFLPTKEMNITNVYCKIQQKNIQFIVTLNWHTVIAFSSNILIILRGHYLETYIICGQYAKISKQHAVK